MREHWVTGAGGVRLHVAEAGPQDAPAVLMVHGYSQCHLSWEKQLEGLSGRFRVVAPDLRGHGRSDKPEEGYDKSADWGADIAAVIAALGLERPILVGWSMGGWVVCDYLAHHGGAGIGGVVLVGSNLLTGKNLPAEVAAARDADVVAAGMYEGDLTKNLAATLSFVRACFHQQPAADDLARIVGFNMLVPPAIRRDCRTRTLDHRPAFAGFAGPKLLMQGARERVCVPAAFELLKEAAPDARVAMFENSGHSPFWEEPEMFNETLAGFVTRCREAA